MTAIFEQGSKRLERYECQAGPRRAGLWIAYNDKIDCLLRLLDNTSGNTNPSQGASRKVQTKECGNLGAQNCDFRLV